MKSSISAIKIGGTLESFEDSIRSVIEDAIPRIEKKIRLSVVEIVVENKPEATIPETGLGGYAPDANHLYIRINPEKEGLRENFEREFRSTLTHELHHCARWASVGYGTTLLEAIVSEGLADHFDIEMNGGESKPWSVALNEKELELARTSAEPVFHSEYDEAEWFFGTGEIPKWAGYSLGFEIVGNYIKKSGKLASELVNEPASAFVG